MRRLILMGSAVPGLMRSNFAELVIFFSFRFVWGPLPSATELAAYLSTRSDKLASGAHWSDYTGRWPKSSPKGRRDLALADFCRPYDVIDLWFDPSPNDQLQLVWLLDYLGSFPEVAAKLRLRVIDFDLLMAPEEMPEEAELEEVDVTDDELETARRTWRAYRSNTPEACLDLLRTDLSASPMLRPALLDVMKELPCTATGLGATETRFLEMIARGYSSPNALFHLRTLRGTRVFSEFEHWSLLEGLGLGPRPAVAGLDEALRTLEERNYRDRLEAHRRGRLSLTEFGKAVLAGKEDFRRHNPIHRWWGGTELTSDRLWRLDRVLIKPAEKQA